MSTHTEVFVAALVLATSLAAAPATQHPAMPPGVTHEEHLAQMRKDAELKKRGAAAMGFDQDKTSHHFRLTVTGGTIEVSVNDPSDETSRKQIRAHLKGIAAEFESGSFAKPFATHREEPPGSRVMEQRKNTITYGYEDTTGGGRVQIKTTDERTKSAVHEFLRYQIREHATGDPLTVSNEG
jgi:hypothetical protein